MLKKG
jgi:hypothetical protein